MCAFELGFVFPYQAKKLASENVSEVTYFVLSGTYKNSSGDEIANVNFLYDDTYMHFKI